MVVLGILVTAFITGALARFALPGPDPMPVWLTIAIGLVGTFIGYSIVWAVEGRDLKNVSWAGIASFFAAVGIVVLYRRLIQKRAVWGRDAYRFPERGVRVAHYRERLRKVGIDPDSIGAPYGVPQAGVAVPPPARSVAHDGPGEPTDNPAHYLGLLEELHDSGVLDDAEYDGARLRLLDQLR